ncbi:hypothetical protein [Soonwooa sp.]|uniref:hypothetical protein n=1 Tax=Soonwooa sp. TaxID=1938592 RepID=UPI0035B467D7
MKISFLVIIILVFTNFHSFQETQKFSDSKTVIKNNHYKLDVVQKNLNEEALVSFSLFKKINKKWIKLKDYRFQKKISFSLLTQVKTSTMMATRMSRFRLHRQCAAPKKLIGYLFFIQNRRNLSMGKTLRIIPICITTRKEIV